MSNQEDGFEPMLACDWHEDRIKFPCIVQVKLDGVHSVNRHGKLLGRRLRAHDNKYTTERFSKDIYHGFCGEMTNGILSLSDNSLCRITSGDLRRIEGEPIIDWWLFDYVTEETKNLPYVDRMAMLDMKLHLLQENGNLDTRIKVIQSHTVNNMQELLDLEERYLQQGAEGVIIRDPLAKYKYGRCGKTFMGCWRIKRFIEEEILVTAITEGLHNANEATKNELGRTKRSTHQENMQPNGMLGSIEGTALKDIKDPQSAKVLIKKGDLVTVGPGEMPHDMRKHYWENKNEIVGHVIKFKLFPKGMKDLPRFPTYVSHKNDNDV